MVPLPDGAVRLTDYPKHRADAEANRRSKQPLGVEASSEEESDKLRRDNAFISKQIGRRRRIRHNGGRRIVTPNKPSSVSLPLNKKIG